ncbi:MAG TPA: CoA-binding protein [Chloroflexia bacterium]|nr:CoA-binding protein [Chloroflexia bacterium]
MPAGEAQPYRSPAAILQGLAGHTIAVVGLSSDPASPSHAVAAYLQKQGYHIIPVNPKEEEVLGERAYPSLHDIPERVDVVDVFRRPDAVPGIVEEAITAGVPVLWLQLGVVNEDAARRAAEAGITVVMDRCMKIEHALRRQLESGADR